MIRTEDTNAQHDTISEDVPGGTFKLMERIISEAFSGRPMSRIFYVNHARAKAETRHS